MEMVKSADGDKQVALEAAKMKDEWLSLILLQQKSLALRAYTTRNSTRWHPRGRGLPAGWRDEHEWPPRAGRTGRSFAIIVSDDLNNLRTQFG